MEKALENTKAEELNKMGLYFIEKERYNDALKYFNMVLEENAECIDAYYNKAMVYVLLGEADKALEYYDLIISKKPIEGEAVFQKANVTFFMKKDIEEAIRLYNKAIYLGVNKENLYYNLSLCYDMTRNFNQALIWIDKVINIKGESVEAYNKKANILQKMGEFSSAIENYNKTLMIEVNNEEANHFKSLILGEMGQYQEALDLLKKTEDLIKDKTVFKYDMAIILEKQNKLQEALEEIEKCEKIKPDNFQILIKKATIYFKMRETDKAIDIYNRLIEIYPENMDVRFNKASLFMTLQKYGEALEDFDYIIENMQQNDMNKINSYYFKALALKLIGSDKSKAAYEKAIQQYSVLIISYPYDSKLYILKANALRDIGRNDEAEIMYEYALDLKPEQLEIYLMRAKNRITLGKIKEAKADIQNVLEKNSAYISVIKADEELSRCLNAN
jgi:tetratricopeptide (TPR) repeat protein